MMLPWVFAVFSIHQSLCRGMFFFFVDRRPGWKRPWATPGPTLPQPPPPKKAPLSKSAFPPFPPLTFPGRRIYPWPLPRPFPRLHHRTTPVSLFVSLAWRPSSMDHHGEIFFSQPVFGVCVCLLASDENENRQTRNKWRQASPERGGRKEEGRKTGAEKGETGKMGRKQKWRKKTSEQATKRKREGRRKDTEKGTSSSAKLPRTARCDPRKATKSVIHASTLRRRAYTRIRYACT